MSDSRTVHAIYPTVLIAGGVGYTVRELLDNLNGAALRKRLWVIQSYPPLAREYLRPAIGQFSRRVMSKLRISEAWQFRALMKKALREIASGDLAYFWPEYNAGAILDATQRGALAVAERINCMSSLCKVVLERAYGRVGKPLPHGWCTPEGIAAERAQMKQCHFVTAPNEFVALSLLESGIAPERIIRTSYGWSPERLAAAVGIIRPDRKPVFAFVGLGIVRKGLDLLLEAWEKANVEATLLLAGIIHDEIRGLCARQLARPDVQQLGYVTDVAGLYAAADVFVLPTHEEGGPQVTYEAAGCGLASIVSPMGAGRIVRHGEEGYVLDPYDVDAWVEAIRMLARDASLRKRFGASAAERAQEYTWRKVGGRLYENFVRLPHRA